jgi:hypothetical protein
LILVNFGFSSRNDVEFLLPRIQVGISVAPCKPIPFVARVSWLAVGSTELVSGMAFEHACFISYRHHAQSALAEKFIVDLVAALRSELGVLLEQGVYIDRDRMKGGYFFNTALARALCRSVCMIVVYTPTYFSRVHPYCAREFRAMEQLEAARFARLQQCVRPDTGLIIPIVLRGESALPPEIRHRRHYYSFERFSLTSRDIARNRLFEQSIRDIASEIFKRKQMLDAVGDDVCAGCDQYVWPPEPETMAWLDTLTTIPPTFPLRGST